MAVTLPRLPGTYALVLRLPRDARIQVGRLGSLSLPAAWYLYVGSAFGPGGLAARLGRHISGGGRPHWHVDRLRVLAVPVEAWFSMDRERREDDWARVCTRLPGGMPVPGFGASDSRASSHLWYFHVLPSFQGFVQRLHRTCPGHAPLRRLPLGGGDSPRRSGYDGAPRKGRQKVSSRRTRGGKGASS